MNQESGSDPARRRASGGAGSGATSRSSTSTTTSSSISAEHSASGNSFGNRDNCPGNNISRGRNHSSNYNNRSNNNHNNNSNYHRNSSNNIETYPYRFNNGNRQGVYSRNIGSSSSASSGYNSSSHNNNNHNYQAAANQNQNHHNYYQHQQQQQSNSASSNNRTYQNRNSNHSSGDNCFSMNGSSGGGIGDSGQTNQQQQQSNRHALGNRKPNYGRRHQHNNGNNNNHNNHNNNNHHNNHYQNHNNNGESGDHHHHHHHNQHHHHHQQNRFKNFVNGSSGGGNGILKEFYKFDDEKKFPINQKYFHNLRAPNCVLSTLSQAYKQCGLPWVSPGTNYLKDYGNLFEGLHAELEDFYKYIRPNHIDEDFRKATYFAITKSIKRLITDKFIVGQVKFYGSYSSNTYLPVSDIDLVVHCQATFCDHGTVLSEIAAQLFADSIIESECNLIPTSRFPLLQFYDSITGIPINITINTDLAMKRAEFIREEMKRDKHMIKILYFLKFYLLHKGWNTVFRGGIGSYALALMVIRYFQEDATQCLIAEHCPPPSTNPAPRPRKTILARLLIGFLHRYSDLEFIRNHVVSVGSGGVPANCGGGYLAPEALPDSHVYPSMLPGHHEKKKRSALKILDNFEPWKNVSAGSFNSDNILADFGVLRDTLLNMDRWCGNNNNNQNNIQNNNQNQNNHDEDNCCCGDQKISILREGLVVIDCFADYRAILADLHQVWFPNPMASKNEKFDYYMSNRDIYGQRHIQLEYCSNKDNSIDIVLVSDQTTATTTTGLNGNIGRSNYRNNNNNNNNHHQNYSLHPQPYNRANLQQISSAMTTIRRGSGGGNNNNNNNNRHLYRINYANSSEHHQHHHHQQQQQQQQQANIHLSQFHYGGQSNAPFNGQFSHQRNSSSSNNNHYYGGNNGGNRNSYQSARFHRDDDQQQDVQDDDDNNRQHENNDEEDEGHLGSERHSQPHHHPHVYSNSESETSIDTNDENVIVSNVSNDFGGGTGGRRQKSQRYNRNRFSAARYLQNFDSLDATVAPPPLLLTTTESDATGEGVLRGRAFNSARNHRNNLVSANSFPFDQFGNSSSTRSNSYRRNHHHHHHKYRPNLHVLVPDRTEISPSSPPPPAPPPTPSPSPTSSSSSPSPNNRFIIANLHQSIEAHFCGGEEENLDSSQSNRSRSSSSSSSCNISSSWCCSSSENHHQLHEDLGDNLPDDHHNDEISENLVLPHRNNEDREEEIDDEEDEDEDDEEDEQDDSQNLKKCEPIVALEISTLSTNHRIFAKLVNQIVTPAMLTVTSLSAIIATITAAAKVKPDILQNQILLAQLVLESIAAIMQPDGGAGDDDAHPIDSDMLLSNGDGEHHQLGSSSPQELSQELSITSASSSASPSSPRNLTNQTQTTTTTIVKQKKKKKKNINQQQQQQPMQKQRSSPYENISFGNFYHFTREADSYREDDFDENGQDYDDRNEIDYQIYSSASVQDNRNFERFSSSSSSSSITSDNISSRGDDDQSEIASKSISISSSHDDDYSCIVESCSIRENISITSNILFFDDDANDLGHIGSNSVSPALAKVAMLMDSESKTNEIKKLLNINNNRSNNNNNNNDLHNSPTTSNVATSTSQSLSGDNQSEQATNSTDNNDNR